MSNDAQRSYELVHLMTDYASRYGYLLGGLEMVAAGQTSADKVLESYKQKYETTTAAGDVTKHRTLEKAT
jgi:hypothetical protein